MNQWNGDAINYDWVVQTGVPIPYDSKEESLILTLTEDGGGTLLTSTFFVHYGEINATTSRTNGIINAFILMSPGKDEIDIEFPGAENPGNPNTTNVNTAFQTNYFWQGYVPIGTNNGHLEQGLDDTFLNTYTHSIIWSEDTLQWAVNGSVVRTVNRADTKDKNGIYHYPTQPSQVQFSIWASGINGSAPGTIEWGGGMVNWNDPDYKSAGHFFFILDSFSIKCADATSRPANATSYVFDPSQSSSLPVWPNILYADGSTILNNTASAVAAPNLIHATILVGMIITGLMI
ncbi:hypothetical protein H0H93_001222 [Arthromyces matolae]|nr:hypothetical protein H0H93_001222 [Arthromyces matolae]